MNFIYSLIFWTVCFLITTLFKASGIEMNPNWVETLLVFQIIFTSVFFIFSVVAFFYTTSEYQNFHMIKNSIKKYRKDLIQKQEKYETLKSYYEKHLAESYPNLEREIFGKIAESQPKELIALFQSYPELKSSTVLTNMMDKITNLIDKIYLTKQSISYEEERIDNIETNPWLIIKPKNI